MGNSRLVFFGKIQRIGIFVYGMQPILDHLVTVGDCDGYAFIATAAVTRRRANFTANTAMLPTIRSRRSHSTHPPSMRVDGLLGAAA